MTEMHNRRWYDNISNMTMALHVSRQLPREIQLIIAHHLNDAINDYRKMRRSDKNAISLGSQRVLGLYKASDRQRWYDPTPQIHRAFTMMPTVPELFLSEFAGRILDAGRYLDTQQQYGNYGDRYQLASTVESILTHKDLAIEESEGGIKLVGNDLEIQPTHPRQGATLKPKRLYRQDS